MEKQETIKLLKSSHHSFITYINSLTGDDFLFAPPQKWTAGQQLQHIYLSVRPIVLALSLPKLLVRIVFGSARKPSMTYDELVKTYLHKLDSGYKATAPYIPKSVTPDQKETIIAALDEKVNALCSRIETFSESELDSLRLPHPLLGKLTMREMLYFTIYHVEHHEGTVRKALTQSPPATKTKSLLS